MINELKELSNCEERWKVILQHRDKFHIFLDNDDTYVVSSDFETNEEYVDLDSIGNQSGIYTLLGVLGVSCENV